MDARVAEHRVPGGGAWGKSPSASAAGTGTSGPAHRVDRRGGHPGAQLHRQAARVGPVRREVRRGPSVGPHRADLWGGPGGDSGLACDNSGGAYCDGTCPIICCRLSASGPAVPPHSVATGCVDPGRMCSACQACGQIPRGFATGAVREFRRDRAHLRSARRSQIPAWNRRRYYRPQQRTGAQSGDLVLGAAPGPAGSGRCRQRGGPPRLDGHPLPRAGALEAAGPHQRACRRADGLCPAVAVAPVVGAASPGTAERGGLRRIGSSLAASPAWTTPRRCST